MKVYKTHLKSFLAIGALLGAGAVAHAEKFSIVVLPDTQNYANEYAGWNIYLHQAQWITNNQVASNIVFVAHMGDITDDGGSQSMWNVATNAHNVLSKAGIPFLVVPGNHDYDTGGPTNREAARYRANFGSTNLNSTTPPVLGTYSTCWYEGHMGNGIENTYTTFTNQGLAFLVIGLEYAPRKEAICWADSVIASHPNHRVIVVTHGYLFYDGVRANLTDEYTVIGSDGWNVWDEMIQRHNNIFMVLSGHKGDSEYQQRLGLAGNVIHEILTDYQFEEPKNSGAACGNGWLRLLTFDPAANTVDVSTLTVEATNTSIFPGNPPLPQFWITNYEGHATYSTNANHPDHQFSFAYDMTSGMRPYTHIPGVEHWNDRTINVDGWRNQLNPDVAVDANGNFVVVWEHDTDTPSGTRTNIYMRGFYAGGCEHFPETKVNSTLAGVNNVSPRIAMDPNGNFVVVWRDNDFKHPKTGNQRGSRVYMRGFDANGNERFSEQVVNTVVPAGVDIAAIAMATNGDFVVVWDDDNDGNGSYQVYGRGYDVNGNQRFGRTTLNEIADDSQVDPDIAMAANGDFVVVWMDDAGGLDQDIERRMFYANGTAITGDDIVNTTTDGEHEKPRVAMSSDRKFTVVWQYDSNDNKVWGVWYRRYDSNGNGLGNMTALRPTSISTSNQENARISMDASGNWVAVWQDWDIDGPGGSTRGGLMASGYYSNGNAWFLREQVNSELAGYNRFPNVALHDDGSFVTVWADDSDENNYYEILGRRIQHYDVTIEAGPGGSVNPSGIRKAIASGFKTNIVASAGSGSFDRWTGGAEDPMATKTYVFVDGNRTVTAWFPCPRPTLLASQAPGQVELQIGCAPGLSIEIQHASDLANPVWEWAWFGTITNGTQVVHLPAPAASTAFWRAVVR